MDKEEILKKAEIEQLDPRSKYIFKFEEDIPSKELQNLVEMMKEAEIHDKIIVINAEFEVIEVENNDADN